MEKHQVLAKFYNVNNQIQEYRIRKNKEIESLDQSEEKLSGHDDLKKYSGNARRTLIILMSEENINQRNIAKMLDISSQAVSETIKKLEQGGCVEKVAGVQNNENIIQITPLGKAIAEMFQEKIKVHAQYVFSDMTDEEIETFNNLLCKMKTK